MPPAHRGVAPAAATWGSKSGAAVGRLALPASPARAAEPTARCPALEAGVARGEIGSEAACRAVPMRAAVGLRCAAAAGSPSAAAAAAAGVAGLGRAIAAAPAAAAALKRCAAARAAAASIAPRRAAAASAPWASAAAASASPIAAAVAVADTAREKNSEELLA